MKYCLICPSLVATGADGPAASLARLAGALARRGHEVHLLRAADPGPAPPGVVVHAIRRRWWSALGAIRRRLGALRPEVVHLHDPELAARRGLLEITSPGAIKLLTTQAIPSAGRPADRLARASRTLDGLICPGMAGIAGVEPRGPRVAITQIPHLPADGDAWSEADHVGRYLTLIDSCRRARRIRFDHARPHAGPKARGKARREVGVAGTSPPG